MHILVGVVTDHLGTTAEIETAALMLDVPLDGVSVSDHFGVMSNIELAPGS